MKKKYAVIAISAASIALSTGLVFAANRGLNVKNLTIASDGNYWNHYAAVEPTQNRHGSKEFWASCSTHNFQLTHPGAGADVREGVPFDTTTYFDELTVSDLRYIHALGDPQYTITFNSMGGSSVASITDYAGTVVEEPSKPTKDSYKFTGWSLNSDGSNQVTWPYTINGNVTMYANWNEKVNIKGYLQTLIAVLDHDPYSYIPDTMRPENSVNHVTPASVNYDFSTFTNVSSINYGGYGEQWHMVIENIKESERYYTVATIGEAAINSSIVAFNNYLDSNTEDTASHTLYETEYTASINFDGTTLDYSIQYNTSLTIPFFGGVIPQIDMSYNVTTLEKTVRIQLSENNAMKYVVDDNSYTFGLEYGIEQVSRKAYFSISKDNNDEVEGHIYEFVEAKGKEMIPSCADFYIDDDYTSVVGNKASGIIGFNDYINELYVTAEARLLGYEIMETKTVSAVSVTFNTLWFNLDDISGISNICYVDSDHATDDNPEGFHLNNSTKAFATKNVGGLSLKTASRRYDIENRKQYFYGYQNGVLSEFETNIPMMFVQQEQLGTFNSDVNGKNSYLDLNIAISQYHLAKIESDYESLIDVFIENKDDIDGDYIETFVGEAVTIL